MNTSRTFFSIVILSVLLVTGCGGDSNTSSSPAGSLSGNYSIYYSKYSSGMLPIITGQIDFTLNPDGTIIVINLVDDFVGSKVTKSQFKPDSANNLYFRVSRASLDFDLKINANIDTSYAISGDFILYGALGNVTGSVSGVKN